MLSPLLSHKVLIIGTLIIVGIWVSVELFTTDSIFRQGATSVIAFNNGNIKTELYTDLKERFRQVTLTEGALSAIALLEKESKEDERVFALCHDILHVIGRSTFTDTVSFSEALQVKESFCNSGYIHGLFEAFFENENYSVTELQKICLEYASESSYFTLWQCHHGIGHGLMYFTNGDLDVALALCTEVLTVPYSEDCQNGVYMEVFNGEFLSIENSYFRDQNPFTVCKERQTLRYICYAYAPTYLSENSEMSYVDILKRCDELGQEYKRICSFGVIKEATKRNMDNLEDVFTLCSLFASKDDSVSCGSSVVSMYLFQTGSIDAGRELCTIVSNDFYETCIATVLLNEDFFKVGTIGSQS